MQRKATTSEKLSQVSKVGNLSCSQFFRFVSFHGVMESERERERLRRGTFVKHMVTWSKVNLTPFVRESKSIWILGWNGVNFRVVIWNKPSPLFAAAAVQSRFQSQPHRRNKIGRVNAIESERERFHYTPIRYVRDLNELKAKLISSIGVFDRNPSINRKHWSLWISSLSLNLSLLFPSLHSALELHAGPRISIITFPC